MSAGLTSGTLTIPAGGSQPAQLDSTPDSCKSVLVHNPTGNSTIYVGSSVSTSSTGIPISAGQSVSIPTGDSGSIYINGTQNDVVRYLISDSA